MIWLVSAFNLLRKHIFAVVVSAFAFFALMQQRKADHLRNKTEELQREVHTLEIQAEADEVRSRPVSRDKRDILGRM